MRTQHIFVYDFANRSNQKKSARDFNRCVINIDELQFDHSEYSEDEGRPKQSSYELRMFIYTGDCHAPLYFIQGCF